MEVGEWDSVPDFWQSAVLDGSKARPNGRRHPERFR